VDGPPDDPSARKRTLDQLAAEAALLIAESTAQFQRDLAEQLQQQRDESLNPIDPGDPRWALLVEVATALVKAGFRIDDCMVAGHLGGACLLVTPNGLVVRWSQHDLSGYQFDRPDYRQIQQIMGKALAEVLRALGFRLTPTKFPGSYLVSRGTRE
jgi:hypothetical protein